MTTTRVAICVVFGGLAMFGGEPLAARWWAPGAAGVAAAQGTSDLPVEAASADGDAPEPAMRGAWESDTMAVRAVIRSTLHDALDSSAARSLPPGARAELAWRTADVLKYRVDMSRELRDGSVLSVLFLRSVREDGTVRIGSVLAARVETSREPIEAIRFVGAGRSGEYFDQSGRSLRAAFLRAPLAFRRISSVFGPRQHPILGGWREHRGTDYAAAPGTPVHSVADGIVTFAGTRRGYGNLVEVRHANGVVTRYGHLRGFAPHVGAAAPVKIGQTVGYVGMTGLATGPHLHFETLVNGVPRDPGATLPANEGAALAGAERPAFESTRAMLLASLDRRAGR